MDGSSGVSSAAFTADLEAAQQIWTAPGVIEAAGSLVLLTYFAIPSLLAVRPIGGSLRSVVDGHRERDFLHAMLGLGERSEGGIGNPAVRARARSLAMKHRQYPGMRADHMDFIAGLLALSPLLLLDRDETADTAAYWRYMGRMMALLGCDRGSVDDTEKMCTGFVEAYAGASIDGHGLVAAFGVRHPESVRRAVPALFPPARRVVLESLG